MKLGRSFLFTLYGDSPSYNLEKTIISIVSDCEDFYIVTHLPSKKANFTQHHHLLVRMRNACTLERLSERYNVSISHISICRNWNETVSYLEGGD